MKIKKVWIYSGFTESANKITKDMQKQFVKAGFRLDNSKPDLVVTVGGDGTLLKYARLLNYPSTPFIGVNAGTVGFMQELDTKDVPEFLKELKKSEFKIREAPLLKAEVIGDELLTTLAFNEIVVSRHGPLAVHMMISINGRKFEKFVGDGLILTTPQGSTAYGLAAGGAIFPFSVNAFQLVPSHPHDSVRQRTIRAPMLLPDDAELNIEVLDPRHRPVFVTADGDEIFADGIKKVNIAVSKRKFNILRTKRFNFYERISEKLIGGKK